MSRIKDQTLTNSIVGTDVIALDRVTPDETFRATAETLKAFCNTDPLFNKAVHSGGDIGGYIFDGVNDYISVADNDNLDFGTNSFSIEVTCFLLAQASAITTLARKGDSAARFYLRFNADGKLALQIYDGTNSHDLITNSPVTPGKITVCAVIEGRTLATLYVNGVIASVTKTGTFSSVGSINNSSGLYIGAYTAQFAPIIIYQVRFFNRALILTEVIAFYNNGRPDLYVMPVAYRGASATDLLSGFNFTSGWVPGGGVTVNDNNTFTSTGIGGIWKQLLTVGNFYKLIVSGITTSISCDIRQSDDSGTNNVQITTTLEQAVYFTATKPYIYVRNSGAGTTDITTFTLIQIGCVLDLHPQNAGNLGWIDSSGNQLSGATSGSPICLTVASRPPTHREIKKSIANTATALTNIVPPGYRISAIRAKGSTTLSTVIIGTSSGGNQIVASSTVTTTAKLLTLATTANDGYSETGSTTLYAQHSTAGGTLDLIFELEKVGN
jgi:hypothetical protein